MNEPSVCPRCKSSDTDMMMQVTIVIPTTLRHELSKSSFRRSDVQLYGALWETADIICRSCGHIIDGYGNYVSRLQKRVAELEAQLTKNNS